MKLLQVIPGFSEGFGGPTNVLLRLSAILAHAGHEVTVFTTDADVRGRLKVPLGEPVRKDGFTVWYFPVQFSLRYKVSLPFAQALKQRVKEFDAVHIHALFQFPTLAACYYCRNARVPYLLRPLGHLDPYSLQQRRWAKAVAMRVSERRILRDAWGVHFTTAEEARLAARLGLQLREVVIGLGFDTDEFSQLPAKGFLRERYPALQGKKILLFLGRIHYKKGFDILVKAYAQVLRARDDTRLVIAGPDNDGYAATVQGWLRQEGILDKAVFTGMLAGKDKLAAFVDSDIFVLPSYSENFGMAVIEAMAAGLPVVVSEGVNLSPMVAATGAGIVVAPEVSALAAGIERLLIDDALRMRTAEAAKKAAWKDFSIRQSADALVAVYAKMQQSKIAAKGGEHHGGIC